MINLGGGAGMSDVTIESIDGAYTLYACVELVDANDWVLVLELRSLFIMVGSECAVSEIACSDVSD